MGMSGSKVWEQYSLGEIKAIRDYCETDALNTYLVYLQWQYVKGNLTDAALATEYEVVKQTLANGEPHLKEFLEVWNA